MVAKTGRPSVDNPKDYMLRVRMDEDTVAMLDACCENEQKSRSEVVRESIKERYEKIKK